MDFMILKVHDIVGGDSDNLLFMSKNDADWTDFCQIHLTCHTSHPSCPRSPRLTHMQPEQTGLESEISGSGHVKFQSTT
jgi:hypothetical protein